MNEDILIAFFISKDPGNVAAYERILALIDRRDDRIREILENPVSTENYVIALNI
jgi:hypothetical protein